MAQDNDLVLILDNVRSMYNVGAIFRLAAGLGVSKIYLCGMTAKPPRAEIHKTALGGEIIVPWEYFAETKDAIKKCRDENKKIIALEITPDAKNLSGYNFDANIALVVGHETEGVGKSVLEMVDEIVFIPMQNLKSLNVSTATAIAVWCIMNKKD